MRPPKTKKPPAPQDLVEFIDTLESEYQDNRLLILELNEAVNGGVDVGQLIGSETGFWKRAARIKDTE